MNKYIMSISKIQKTYLHDLIPQFQDNIKLRLFHVSHPARVLLPLLTEAEIRRRNWSIPHLQ